MNDLISKNTLLKAIEDEADSRLLGFDSGISLEEMFDCSGLDEGKKQIMRNIIKEEVG